MKLRTVVSGLLLVVASCATAAPSAEEVKAAMDRAMTYARDTLSQRGGYLWWYSTDLQERAGEGRPVNETTVWVQYPGTAAVGELYLEVYETTGDQAYLDAATAAGEALAWGQLASGGWDYRLDFGEGASNWHYRRDVEAGDTETGKRRNTSTLDDDNTQSALRFLMRLDAALAQKNEEIHKSVMYGLDKFLGAQYAVGAWPQRFTGPAGDEPVLQASYPDDWPREFPKADYKEYYTLNDNTLRDCIRTAFLAHEIYGDQKYWDAAVNGGEFLLRAQMPEPQPVWAQQYTHDMKPAWARKFEPPSVTGGESAGAMSMLFDLWVKTGDERFIEPLPRAIEWYKRVQLPDGKWARFYELKTDKPLYFVKNTYELTYDDGNTPTHYAFKGNWGDNVIKNLEPALAKSREEHLASRDREVSKDEWKRRAERRAGDVEKDIAALDGEGRWTRKQRITLGAEEYVQKDVVSIQEYLQRMHRLNDYLEALRNGQ